MKAVEVILKDGRRLVFPQARFHERQVNAVTVFDESYAIVAEFYKHDIASFDMVEIAGPRPPDPTAR